MVANKVFLDASYVIALAVARDEHHAKALDIRARIQSQKYAFDHNDGGCLRDRKRVI